MCAATDACCTQVPAPARSALPGEGRRYAAVASLKLLGSASLAWTRSSARKDVGAPSYPCRSPRMSFFKLQATFADLSSISPGLLCLCTGRGSPVRHLACSCMVFGDAATQPAAQFALLKFLLIPGPFHIRGANSIPLADVHTISTTITTTWRELFPRSSRACIATPSVHT